MFRGEIYFAELPNGIGSEQSGKRPVLIVQNDIGNKYSPTTICAPITTKINKHKMPTHVLIPSPAAEGQSMILFEQIRVIDKSRITQKIGVIDNDTMIIVNKAIKISLGL